jgi:hypothetical protein
MHDNVLTFETFLSEYPPHPNCECFGVSTKDDFTEELPKKDPSNWSNIVE